MVVRIRISAGQDSILRRRYDAKFAMAFAGLLTPAAVLCFVMGLWGVLADTGFAKQFVFEDGLLSHWQVWLALGVLVQAVGIALDKYGKHALRVFEP
jgi:hypothetical protein